MPQTRPSFALNVRPPRAWWRAAREFFAYHGVWAFGVRALRLWSLRAKMLLLVAVMALPLLPLMLLQIADREALVKESAHRMAGLQVSAAIVEVGSAVDLQLTALETGRPADPAPMGRALAALRAVAQDAGARGLSIEAVLHAQRAVLDRAADPAELSPSTRLEALMGARHAVATIRRALVAVSRVPLSADPALAARASLAVDQLPALRRELAVLRGLAGRQVELLAQPGRPAAGLHGVLVAAAGRAEVVERLQARIEQALEQAGESQRPQAVQLLQSVRSAQQLLQPGMLSPEPQPDLAALRTQLRLAFEHSSALLQLMHDGMLAELQAQHDTALAQQRGLFTALALTVALAAYLTYSFFLVMRGGLAQLGDQMARMAQGDLSGRPQPRGGDEVAQSLQAMTVSLARLSDLLASVRLGVDAISQASRHIADGNGELAERSRAGAEGLGQLIEAVSRYSVQLQTCAQRVADVVATAQTLRLASTRNRKQMGRLQQRMAGLRASSREIGQIVRLIDSIAFRTNILALNASVEASKAGEAGRGFAVVAQEVRALATRSAESARQVGEIIAGSTLEIEQGGTLADETGRALDETDGHVDAIHAAMSGVAEITRQGNEESAEILAEIHRLKDGTARNLELVDRLAQASDALRGQGERLSHKVGLFKLS